MHLRCVPLLSVSMPILPGQFASTPALTLLRETEKGLIGLDQRLFQSLLDRRE